MRKHSNQGMAQHRLLASVFGGHTESRNILYSISVSPGGALMLKAAFLKYFQKIENVNCSLEKQSKHQKCF